MDLKNNENSLRELWYYNEKRDMENSNSIQDLLTKRSILI